MMGDGLGEDAAETVKRWRPDNRRLATNEFRTGDMKKTDSLGLRIVTDLLGLITNNRIALSNIAVLMEATTKTT